MGELSRRAREMERRAKLYPDVLAPIPHDEFRASLERTADVMVNPPLAAWRSKRLLVVLYAEPRIVGRLSVQRTTIHPVTGHWLDGILWDELQEAKAQVGFGDTWAVEVFPPTSEIVNVANIRHLWLLQEAPPFGWVSSKNRNMDENEVAR